MCVRTNILRAYASSIGPSTCCEPYTWWSYGGGEGSSSSYLVAAAAAPTPVPVVVAAAAAAAAVVLHAGWLFSICLFLHCGVHSQSTTWSDLSYRRLGKREYYYVPYLKQFQRSKIYERRNGRTGKLEQRGGGGRKKKGRKSLKNVFFFQVWLCVFVSMSGPILRVYE